MLLFKLANRYVKKKKPIFLTRHLIDRRPAQILGPRKADVFHRAHRGSLYAYAQSVFVTQVQHYSYCYPIVRGVRTESVPVDLRGRLDERLGRRRTQRAVCFLASRPRSGEFPTSCPWAYDRGLSRSGDHRCSLPACCSHRAVTSEL